MKDKEIEEMAMICCGSKINCSECFEEFKKVMNIKSKKKGEHCQAYNYAEKLYNEGYRKIPDGAVVLTEGEYSDILSDEIQTIKRDVAEFWANANFDKVVKELHNLGYRKLDDHAIMVLRKAHGIENKIRKETADEIFETLLLFLDGETFTVGKELKKVKKKILKMAKEMGVNLLYEELF